MSSNPVSHDAAPTAASDTLIAVKSAFTLGTSLVATWSVALLVRFYLPRHLGPARFGALSFADSFAATAFIALGLGVETYIQKEIPVRPRHASDFFCGFIVLRLAMSTVIFGAVALALGHRSPEVQRAVFVFGAGQFVVVLNGNLAALLHATRAVGELAVINVAAKLLWGLGVALALFADLGLPGLALAFLVAEAGRACALLPLARRHVGIRMVWDPRAVKAVVAVCLPFYLNQMAITAYAKIDVALLSVLSNDAEVGWYGAASNLAGLSFLLSPLIGWVLMPLLSRAAARSEEEMFGILRRAVRVLVTLVLPLPLVIGIGADLWVRSLFGTTFSPAATSLRILAPMLVLTYVAMVAATCLVLVGRAWTVTALSLAGLFVNVSLNALLVPRAMCWLGPGGAGAGAATALVITELGVTAALLAAIGARAFDRASSAAVAKAFVSCAIAAAAALLFPPGLARLAIGGLTYVALLFVLGAARAEDARRGVALITGRIRRHAIS